MKSISLEAIAKANCKQWTLLLISLTRQLGRARKETYQVSIEVRLIYAASFNKAKFGYKDLHLLAVVVAQLVEQSLLISEVRGSNPVIDKKNIYIEHLFTVIYCVLKRRK